MKIVVVLALVLLASLYFGAWGITVLVWRQRYFVMRPTLIPQTLIPQTPIPQTLYKTGETDTLPAAIQKLYSDTLDANPGYHIDYFSATRRRQFIEDHFARDVLEAYDTLVPGAYKADLWRLCALYEYGGIYGDFSQQYLVPLSTLVAASDELVLTLDAPLPPYPLPFRLLGVGGISNAFMAAVPKHPFMKKCIDQIVDNVRQRYYGWSALDITGPGLVRQVLSANPDTRYRMDIALFSHDEPKHFVRMDTGEKVIRFKMPGHYTLLGAKNAPSYTWVWLTGKVYSA